MSAQKLLDAARILFLVLAKAIHKIKTGYGISDWVYGDEEVPISGCGQGNGLGPALWALISTKVIKMCERAGHGTMCIAPYNAAGILFLVLAKARHKIKTGYGTSDWVYGNEEVPISGCGQGNGLGPALWALISTKVIKMCERAGHGTTCIAPDRVQS
jgi:hypothetical protein